MKIKPLRRRTNWRRQLRFGDILVHVDGENLVIIGQGIFGVGVDIPLAAGGGETDGRELSSGRGRAEYLIACDPFILIGGELPADDNGTSGITGVVFGDYLGGR